MSLNKQQLTLISTFLLLSSSLYAAETPPAKAQDAPSKTPILIEEKELLITSDEALLMLKDMNSIQRERVLADPEKFKNLIQDLLILKKKANAAKALKLDENPVIQWKIENKKDLILSEQLAVHFTNNLALPNNLNALAKEYYDAHPEEFALPETVQVAHLLIKTNKEDKKEEKLAIATKLLDDLKKGLDFSTAAEQHSDDTGSKKTGGEMPAFTRGKMVKPFEDAAFTLKKVGDLSEIVETRFGYHIIKLLQHTPASTKPFKDVENVLVQQQTKKYIKTKRGNYLNEFNLNKQSIIYIPAVEQLLDTAKKTLATTSKQPTHEQ